MGKLFDEKIVQEFVDEYDREYAKTKNNKGKYTLYKKSLYSTRYGFDYDTVSVGQKNISNFIKENKLTEVGFELWN